MKAAGKIAPSTPAAVACSNSPTCLPLDAPFASGLLLPSDMKYNYPVSG